MTDASMPEPTSGPPAHDVYERCDPAFLRQLQETSGMDDTRLARIACLSLDQLRQLKAGGDSMFYSPAIKRQAYRRLLMVLGAPPPASSEALAAASASVAPPAPSQAIENIVALSERNEYLDRRPLVDTLRDLRVRVRQYRQPLAALALLAGAVVLFLFNRPVELEPQVAVNAPVAAPPASKAEPSMPNKAETPAAMPQEPVGAALAAPVPSQTQTQTAAPAALAAPVAAAASSPLKGCAYSQDKWLEVSPLAAQKEGRYVYVVSPTDTEICVVDGKRQATTLSLRAGEGRSVYGVAPWQLSGGDLGKLQIYFQGWRVSLPEEATQRVTLVEKPL